MAGEGGSEERVTIADILRPRGNKGELLVISQTDVPGRLENLKQVQITLHDGSDLEMPVESIWSHKGNWVFKFSGVDSISDAERFSGAEVWVTRSDRGELPEGKYFQSDLIGSTVVDRQSNCELGLVVDYQDYGGAPLLEVNHQGRSILVPLVPEICQVIDVAAKRILVELPEGLLDL